MGHKGRFILHQLYFHSLVLALKHCNYGDSFSFYLFLAFTVVLTSDYSSKTFHPTPDNGSSPGKDFKRRLNPGRDHVWRSHRCENLVWKSIVPC